MADDPEAAEEAGDAGTSGIHFCRWCRENWKVYEMTGGVCELLSLKPLSLDPAGSASLSAVLPARLGNPLGSIHGGVASMLLDEVGGLAVCCSVGFRYLRGTSKIEVSFLKRAAAGPAVARATAERVDETTFRAESEIVQGDVVVARSSGTYTVYAPGQVRRPPRGEIAT